MPDQPSPLVLDTSVIVRYLTDDPPDMAERAAQVIDSDLPLLVCEIVLVETAYVLSSVYGIERGNVVDALIAFVQRYNVSLLDLPKPLAIEALELCRPSRRHSFVDAMLWAHARHHRTPRICTFDARFPSQGVEIVHPV